jgi:nicotinamide-nucleotide amidase
MVFEKTTFETLKTSKTLSTQGTKFLVAMPGVPHEMKIAMTEQVLPYIGLKMQVERIEKGDIIHRTILLSGVPESKLAILIEDWEAALPASIHLAYLPKDGMIRLRLSSYGESSKEDIQAQIDTLLPLIGDKVLSVSDPSDFSDMSDLSVLAGQLLKQIGATIATAESCTGGRLAAALNAQSGASAYYMGSVVAYDNTVKTNVLGVSQETLNTFGAVSEYTVREMAEGVRALMHTDFAIATSGMAGPLGGTEDKPVGTVWIAWATADGTVAECFHFGAAREREQITMRAVTAALVRLIRILNAGKYHVEA